MGVFLSTRRGGRLLLALHLLAGFGAGCAGGDATKDSEAGPPASSQAPAPSPAVDPLSFPEVVARVNGSEIRQGDLLERAKSVSRGGNGEEPGSAAFYSQVLDDLISSELLFQESVAKGFVPSDAEVDQRVEVIRSRFPSPEEFRSALGKNGLTEAKMKAALRKDLGVERLLQKEVTASVSVDDAEVRKFFDENADKMRSGDELRVSHILVKADPNASQNVVDQARQKAEALRKRVVAGEDFAKVARENSDDPGSAALGGDLSWMGRGVMVRPFEEAAYALSVGEISPVTRTNFGFHILKLVDKRPGKALAFDDVKEQISRYLNELAVQEKIGAKVKSLREKAKVEIFL